MTGPDLLQWKHSLKTRSRGDKRQIFDPIRRKWIALTPEEMVRQLTITYLADVTGCPLSRMSTERQIKVLNMERRYDLVLFDKSAKPWLLAECKAPGLPIDHGVLDQAARYNIALRVPYVFVTNGMHSVICHVDYQRESWTTLHALPRME